MPWPGPLSSGPACAVVDSRALDRGSGVMSTHDAHRRVCSSRGCVCRDEHVGSVCLALPREHGGNQHVSWDDVDLRLFVGLPGRPEDLQPAQSPLLAAT